MSETTLITAIIVYIIVAFLWYICLSLRSNTNLKDDGENLANVLISVCWFGFLLTYLICFPFGIIRRIILRMKKEQ